MDPGLLAHSSGMPPPHSVHLADLGESYELWGQVPQGHRVGGAMPPLAASCDGLSGDMLGDKLQRVQQLLALLPQHAGSAQFVQQEEVNLPALLQAAVVASVRQQETASLELLMARQAHAAGAGKGAALAGFEHLLASPAAASGSRSPFTIPAGYVAPGQAGQRRGGDRQYAHAQAPASRNAWAAGPGAVQQARGLPAARPVPSGAVCTTGANIWENAPRGAAPLQPQPRAPVAAGSSSTAASTEGTGVFIPLAARAPSRPAASPSKTVAQPGRAGYLAAQQFLRKAQGGAVAGSYGLAQQHASQQHQWGY